MFHFLSNRIFVDIFENSFHVADVVTKQLFWPFYVSAASVSFWSYPCVVLFQKMSHDAPHTESVSLNILGLLELIVTAFFLKIYT